jgi:MerR family transcriptional regulator, heat shock protein HspR
MTTQGDQGLPAAGDAVFSISVAAQLVGTGVQNLRAYEKAGLVEPARTPGGTRLYSADDVTRLRRVLVLLDSGLNLAGIAMVLDLQDDNARLREENARVTAGDDEAVDPVPGGSGLAASEAKPDEGDEASPALQIV